MVVFLHEPVDHLIGCEDRLARPGATEQNEVAFLAGKERPEHGVGDGSQTIEVKTRTRSLLAARACGRS